MNTGSSRTFSEGRKEGEGESVNLRHVLMLCACRDVFVYCKYSNLLITVATSRRIGGKSWRDL